MIKRVYSNRNRVGWKYDSVRKQFFSWHFDIWLEDGRRKRESGFRSKADAESAVARIRLMEKEARYGFVEPEPLPTLREVFDKKLTLIKNENEHTRAVRVFEDVLRCARLKDVSELRMSHLQMFVDYRLMDVQPQSVDRELNIVSAALRAAQLHFPALQNWMPPRIPKPEHSQARRERVISAGEMAKLLTYLYRPQEESETQYQAANRRTVGQVFQFVNLTGARKGEICRLRWEHVDWDAGVIQIVGTKTARRSQQTVRYLKLIPTLMAILRERNDGGEYVFTRNGGEVTHYYSIIKRACAALGLKYGRKVQGGFVTHDGRHTAVTRMLQAGTDLSTIGSITGHGDKTMILRYGHASTDSKNSAMDSLENFAGNKSLRLGSDAIELEAENVKENEKYGAEGGRKRA